MQYIFILLFIAACTPSVEKIPTENTSPSQSVFPPVVDSSALPIQNSLAIPFDYQLHDLKYKQVPITLQKGISFSLKIPENYFINVAAEGMSRLRFLAMSPDGRLFATDMHDRSDNKLGKVLIFADWNSNTKKFATIHTYLSELHNPNQVIFYNDFIYIAETEKLIRYRYKAGDLKPKGAAEIIARFPDYGLGYKYGGWHLTRSLAFNNNKLYVSVGSSCNACIEKEEIRACILEMNPDGAEQKIFASGLRNSVGIKFIEGQLWATGMGRDLIGPDKPEDVFQRIDKNGFYGWPFYFQYKNKVIRDVDFKEIDIKNQKPAPPGFCGFRAHSAPLGFSHLKNFDDAILKNSVLVCLHGSTSAWRQRGNAVVKVGKGNQYQDIVSNFLSSKDEKDWHGRPCDVFMKDNRSFFFTDDLNGVLYYVWK